MSNNSHRAITFGTKPDQSATDEFLKVPLLEFNSYYGIAYVDMTDAGDTSILITSAAGDLDLDQINEVQKGTLKEEAIFHLGKFPDGFTGEYLQPFVLFSLPGEKEGQEGPPALVAFMEGDFSEFEEGDKENFGSPAYNALQAELLPRLSEILEGVGGDIDQFMDKLKSPIHTKDITNLNSNNGCITLVSYTGTVMHFPKTPLIEKPWGWTTLDMGEAQKEEPKKPVVVGATPANKLAALVGKKPDEVNITKTGETTVVTPKNDGTGPQPDISGAPAGESTKIKKKKYPPPEVKSNNELRTWYNRELGMLPQDYKKRPFIWVEEDQPAKSFDEMGVKLQEQEQNVLIPTKQKESVLTMFKENAVVKKIMDSNSEVIADPKFLDSIERPVPSAAEQLGLKGGLELFFTMPRPQLLAWAKAYPEFITNVLDDFRYAYIKTLSSEDLTPKKDETPSAEEAKATGTTGKKVVIPTRKPM